MKSKIALTIISFATTFFIAVAFVTITNQKSFLNFFQKNDPQAQEKIYNFLLADKGRWKEWNDKSSALKLQRKPDAMNELLNERKRIMNELYNERSSANTSELPLDFNEAWSKFLIGEKYLLEIINQEESSKSRSIEEISEEIRLNEKGFKSVVNKYGFELNEVNLIVDEEN